jgi:hypothetical protein
LIEILEYFAYNYESVAEELINLIIDYFVTNNKIEDISAVAIKNILLYIAAN